MDSTPIADERRGERPVRIIFFAGKGGVGKTSLAAATGIQAAKKGYRTIILSLDVAHSLTDIFDLKRELLDRKKGQPVKIGQNLYIQELDIQEEISRNWSDIHRYLSSLLNTTGLDEVLAEELAVLPGMEEVSLLLYINRYAQKGNFDALILDCAPTGESIRFVSIPTTLEWYMKKIFRLERSIVRYARPLARRFYNVPLPEDDYFAALEKLFGRLEGVDRLLTDPEVTSVRLVTNPEKVVLKETQRAFMYFCLYKMKIDAVIMNRMLPDQIKDEYFSDWHLDQQRYLDLARDYFDPVPITTVELMGNEIYGYDQLANLANQLYGNRSPLKHFVNHRPFTFTKVDGHYHLQLKLPFASREDIDINQLPDELILRIGSYKRHIPLPRQVASLESVSAKIEASTLNIVFQGGTSGKS
jgi:arsenite-transporting ATPase